MQRGATIIGSLSYLESLIEDETLAGTIIHNNYACQRARENDREGERDTEREGACGVICSALCKKVGLFLGFISLHFIQFCFRIVLCL